MTDTIVTDWTQVAPRSNQQGGQELDSGPQAWPVGVNVIRGRLDCTPFSGGASTRFDDPSKTITWKLSWSMDGGTTWPYNGGTILGSPTGTWGKAGDPYPHDELDFSYQATLPTHFRAQCTPGQTLNFGVSFQSLNRTPSLH
jgi:hypothetical protein